MPMQATAAPLAATPPVFCPKGRGIKWGHPHGVAKGKSAEEIEVVRRDSQEGGSVLKVL